jgi:hypothetical protein
MNSNNGEARHSHLKKHCAGFAAEKGETLVQRPLGRTIKVRMMFEGDGMLKDLSEGDAPFYL